MSVQVGQTEHDHITWPNKHHSRSDEYVILVCYIDVTVHLARPFHNAAQWPSFLVVVNSALAGLIIQSQCDCCLTGEGH